MSNMENTSLSRGALGKAGGMLLIAGASMLGLFAGAMRDSSASAQESDPSDAQAFVERSCSTCHAYAMATSKGHTQREWLDIVNRMIGLGAPMTPQEAEYAATYLAETHPAPEVTLNAFPVREAPPLRTFAAPKGENQWPAYGGGGENQNYSELDQINLANVSRLQPAWTYRYGGGSHQEGDQGIDYRFEVTPLLIGGIMYISTPSSPRVEGLRASITAIRPETGEVLWKYNSDRNIHGRGIAYWPGDEDHAPRIIFGTEGGFLMAVDVTTGQLAPEFGRNGAIDAYVGVASEVVGESRRASFTIPNPVTIYKDLIITGSRPGESNPPGPRGDIRAWDARTGRLVWTFHTVPQPGEANFDYAPDEWRDISGANVWSTMALDEENGIVYAPLGDLNARAQGSELYSNSLVALNAATGELKWFRQITHKDLWDWDMPTPPVLLDVEKDGETVPGVLLTGKQSLMFLFNRLTGAPLNGFIETPTPRSDVPGTEAWSTQPFPEAPGPLARTTMSRDEIPDLVPGMKEHCESIWDENDLLPGVLYSLPSSTRATLNFPSATGGPNWGGGTYSPDTDMFYINVQNRGTFSLPVGNSLGWLDRPRSTEVLPEPVPDPSASGGRRGFGGPRVSFSFTTENGTVLPCTPAPWGELVAVNIADREIAWRAPLGDFDEIPGPDTGTYNLGGSMATAGGLVFIGASNDQRLRAFDSRTGEKVWETVLEASAHSTPISYLGADGRQYIAVVAAGGTSVGGPIMSDAIVAFALPEEGE